MWMWAGASSLTRQRGVHDHGRRNGSGLRMTFDDGWEHKVIIIVSKGILDDHQAGADDGTYKVFREVILVDPDAILIFLSRLIWKPSLVFSSPLPFP